MDGWLGTVAANGDLGAGFALFIRDKLRLSQAHPVGRCVDSTQDQTD